MFKTVTITKKAEEVLAERRAVLVDFINTKWALVVPKAVPPFDENEQIKSEKNYKALAAALNHYTVIGKGSQPVRADVLADLVAALDKGGYLEHFPETTVEKIVEVEKKVPTPLTRKEAVKASADLTRMMNAKDQSPIKGHGPDPFSTKPRKSLAETEAQARHDLNENTIMGEINSSIQQHRGKTHGDTDAQRKILARIRDEGIDNNTPNAEILKQIETKRTEMIGWDAQQAIRIVYAPQFKERGIDLSQRTASRYGAN